MQGSGFDLDLNQNASTVCLTVIIPKNMGEMLVGAVLWLVSQAFADTEGVSVDRMHRVLERDVQGFESETHFKFLWERCFEDNDVSYPQRLGENLARQRSSQTVN